MIRPLCAGRAWFALSIACLALGPAFASEAWQGTFEYQGKDGYDGGGTASTGNPVIIQFTLTLSGTKCSISEEGFQTDQTALCQAVPIRDGVDLLFKSYADGSLQNQYGVAEYKPGERLFSLSSGKGGAVVTSWGSLKPDFVPSVSGRYFDRGS